MRERQEKANTLHPTKKEMGKEARSWRSKLKSTDGQNQRSAHYVCLRQEFLGTRAFTNDLQRLARSPLHTETFA
jgi:hypothetical protein